MRRLPDLASPFAIVGATAGWVAVAFLSNPLIAMTTPNRGVAAERFLER